MGDCRPKRRVPTPTENSHSFTVSSIVQLPSGRYVHGGKGRLYPQGKEIIFLEPLDLVGVYYAVDPEIPISEHDKLIIFRGPDWMSIDLVAINKTGQPKFIQFGHDNHHAWYKWLHYEYIEGELELVIAE